VCCNVVTGHTPPLTAFGSGTIKPTDQLEKVKRQHDPKAKCQISESAPEATARNHGQCDRNQIESYLVNISEGKVTLEGIYHCFFASFCYKTNLMFKFICFF